MLVPGDRYYLFQTSAQAPPGMGEATVIGTLKARLEVFSAGS